MSYEPLQSQYLLNNGKSQKRISFSQRKKGVKGNHLVHKQSWLFQLINKYDNFEYLKKSGRDYNGADKIFQQVENQMFVDTTDKITQIKVAYIYIISKMIDKEQYFKVGVGGLGAGSRLSGAQTFLIPGLGNDVGFKVHYLFFIPDDYKDGRFYTTDLSKTIEGKVHENLRYYLRTASITFPSYRRSEWYLVPLDETIFFLGLVIDLIASCQYKIQTIWKLMDNSLKKTFEEIKLPIDWRVRMKSHPMYLNKKSIRLQMDSNSRSTLLRPSNQEIRIDSNTSEDAGTVSYFEKHLLKQEHSLHLQDDTIFSFQVVEINERPKALKFDVARFEERNEQDQREWDTIYAVIEIMEENMDQEQVENLVQIMHVSGYPSAFMDPQTNIHFRIYISIGDLLRLLKQYKYLNDNEWVLNVNFDYYESIYYGKSIHYVSETEFIFKAPKWYFEIENQLFWVQTLCDQGKVHCDTDTKTNKQICWKMIDFVTKKSNNVVTIMAKRQRSTDDGEIIDETIDKYTEFIQMHIIMYLYDINRLLLNDVKKKQLPKVMVYDKMIDFSKKNDKNRYIKINESYFTRYNSFNVPESNKIYRKSWSKWLIHSAFQVVDANIPETWITITPYGMSQSKTEWCIPLDHVNSLKQPILIRPLTDMERKNIESNHEKKNGEKKEQDKIKVNDKIVNVNYYDKLRVRNPNYKVGDIIYAKPNQFETFGEKKTENTANHYAHIVSVNLETKTYEIQYFPPWNLKRMWPIFTDSSEVIKRQKYTEQINIFLLEKNTRKYNKSNPSKREKEDYENYMASLQPPIVPKTRKRVLRSNVKKSRRKLR